MKINKLFAITLTAALAVGGFVALETPALGAPVASRFQGGLLARAKEKLGLTDEQTSQIKEAIKADKDNITSLVSRMHDARTELREAIRSNSANEASVRAAAAKVSAVEADVAVERMKLHAKIDPILTDDQRAKVAQFEEHMESVRDNIVDRIEAGLAK